MMRIESHTPKFQNVITKPHWLIDHPHTIYKFLSYQNAMLGHLLNSLDMVSQTAQLPLKSNM